MSTRQALRPSLGQLLRQSHPPSPSSRCLHTLPKRPLRRPSTQSLHHQLPRHRNASTSNFTHNLRTLFRQNPVSISLAALALLSGVGALIYANILYQTYIVGAFHKYPEPVAKKLRKALYYTNTDPQPAEALKFYKQALEVAAEVGMDPFSDEVIGVRIQVGKLMEDVGQFGKAAQVLEISRGDCLEHVRRLEARKAEVVAGEGSVARRTRILAKCVAMSVKLGELYGSPEVYDREMAEERLVWAVETVLRELQRREGVKASEGITEEQLVEREGKWMSGSETGAALESLAHNYEARSQHYLASPLFLQALSLYPAKDCHTVVLMNNLASSLAQQSPRAAAAAQAYATSRNLSNQPTPSAPAPAQPAMTRESLIQNAQTWAQKSLDVAASIRPPERTEECDVGCAVATHNLGEFAEMLGQRQEARRRYEEAISIARAVGFQEGVQQSQERLRLLQTG
ncbi:hypothetical protein BAUCODRAFT_286968 [Baudoinia panamericana UAMH 10762]|uniref:MalT-like TPR region domain-containing protein n=1 Tax=Baudoinia panamericana (strain UAMH 10762) TaxID=717646 RepID=M2N0A6_BAUPA|nr:uncharacterized protein BAUCODRAFT_286968 [Baudoinia panamericana UAMH 10762]EMC92374.1 hypothetical protein BAUCODRAFT_286968 [Baudoinia panamericana UAMH 10762]